jgi:hypothetical protein
MGAAIDTNGDIWFENVSGFSARHHEEGLRSSQRLRRQS